MSMVQPGLELPAYLAAIGYFKRTEQDLERMVWAKTRAHNYYRRHKASRQKVCPECGKNRVGEKYARCKPCEYTRRRMVGWTNGGYGKGRAKIAGVRI